MGDLTVLMGRGGGFAADGRFVARGPETLSGGVAADPAVAAALEPMPADPVEEARAEGFAAGVEAALEEAARLEEAREAARERFAMGFARLDAELAEGLRQRLLDTVVALCEKTLAPLALDAEALTARVAKVAAMFVRADDERVIRLHPEDLELVRGQLPEDWVFAPDPALARGALRVETRSGGAEDGPETWRRAIAEALDLC